MPPKSLNHLSNKQRLKWTQVKSWQFWRRTRNIVPLNSHYFLTKSNQLRKRRNKIKIPILTLKKTAFSLLSSKNLYKKKCRRILRTASILFLNFLLVIKIILISFHLRLSRLLSHSIRSSLPPAKKEKKTSPTKSQRIKDYSFHLVTKRGLLRTRSREFRLSLELWTKQI